MGLLLNVQDDSETTVSATSQRCSNIRIMMVRGGLTTLSITDQFSTEGLAASIAG